VRRVDAFASRLGERCAMTTVYFVCRKRDHLAAPPRQGDGGFVVRHGTTAYCDGRDVDDEHEWIATGGIRLEELLEHDLPPRLLTA